MAWILNHHLKASVGAYKQGAELSQEKCGRHMGHQWRVGKKFGVSLWKIGRKKNI